MMNELAGSSRRLQIWVLVGSRGHDEMVDRMLVLGVAVGAASGDRTHDILSHSQAFCR